MKYAIVQHEDPAVVTHQVCDLMDKDWLPVGGISVSISTYEAEDAVVCGSRIFAQAMVLPDKDSQADGERRILTGRFNS